MAQTIAIQAQYHPIDLAGSVAKAQQAHANDFKLQNAPLETELERMKLNDEIGQQSAMSNFRSAAANGDPASALDTLDAYPEMQAQVDKAIGDMPAAERRNAVKRALAFGEAAKYVDSFPEGSQERQQAWDSTLDVLRSEGYLDQNYYDAARKSGPNKLLLNQAVQTSDYIKKWTDPKLLNDTRMTDAKISDIGMDNARADKALAAKGAGGTASAGRKPPNGYRWTEDGMNLEPIPGGPADAKLKAANAKVTAGAAPTTKVVNEAISVDQAYRNLDSALQDYGELIHRTGTVAIPGPEMDAVNQSRTNLQLQMKELYNLGVLNGPDLSLMQQMIFDPVVSVTSPLDAATKIAGNAGLMPDVASRADASVSRVRGMLKVIRDNKTRGILDENGNRIVGGAQPAAPDASAAPVDQPQQPDDAEEVLQEARDAIANGKDEGAVRQRLIDMGYDPSGL